MTRRELLDQRVHPWVRLNTRPDLEEMPEAQFQQLLNLAGRMADDCAYWYRLGIARAVREMESTTPSGSPRFRTRADLITHLRTIENPEPA